MPIRHILVPTDFSEHADAAARFACRIAQREHASVDLVHVSGLADYSVTVVEPMYMPLKTWEKLLRHHMQRAAARIERIAWALMDEFGGDVVVATHVTRGDVAKSVRDYAQGEDTDLIVVASHGTTGSLRYLHGSVSARIGRIAPCPVLVTRPGAPGNGPPRRALVAVDYSAQSESATHLASELVHAGGHVDLLHVWQEPPLMASPTMDIGRIQQFEIDRMEEFAEVVAMDDDVEVDLHVEIGSLTARIIEAAHTVQPDVIVMGSHERTGIERLVGTATDRVLRHADMPVLMVPPVAEANGSADS